MKSTELLQFINDRLVNVYHEHPNTDYLIALRQLSDDLNLKIKFLETQNIELGSENQFLNDEYHAICELLPKDVRYLDMPDGGSVHPSEQMRRIIVDKDEQISYLKEQNSNANLAGWNACIEWIIETTGTKLFTDKEAVVAYDVGEQYAERVKAGK